MNVLYLGWVGYANIGDDLLFHNFRAYIQKKFGDDTVIKTIYPAEGLEIDLESYDIVAIGGGSVLLGSYIDVLYDAVKLGKKTMVWGSGYDEMLEKEFVDRIENSKIPPYIYSDKHEERLNYIAENADFFGVRGPLTYALLEKSFVNMDKVIISGDAGLLLEEEELDEKGTNLDFDEKNNVVAVNFGGTFNRIYGGNEEIVLESLKKFCIKLIDDGYKIYLYPMWDQDVSILVELYKNLPNKDMVILDVVLHTGGQLLSMLKKCKASINFKLHGNITSALAGTPFICLAYRLKCYDFLKSMDCEELGVATDSEDMFAELDRAFNYILDNENDIKNTLKNKTEEYRKLLIDSFNKL